MTSVPISTGLERVYDSVGSFDGSISAEHGLGQSKREIVADYKEPVELDLMRGSRTCWIRPG